MFDFLAEEKRRIIIGHPSLGGILNSQKNVDRFLDNLSAFEADLLANYDSERKKILELSLNQMRLKE